MLKREELREATATITAAGDDIGSAVPAGYRRYVYRIKTHNLFVGINVLSFRSNPGVPPVVTVLDYFNHLALNDEVADPDDLLEDSAPLYVIGPGEQISGITDAGDCFLRILYVDAP